MTMKTILVKDFITQLQELPPDLPVVNQNHDGTRGDPVQGADVCYWNPKTMETLSIDDVDVEPAFIQAVNVFKVTDK